MTHEEMLDEAQNREKMNEVIIPEGAELIDECFYVWETRYGLFSSMTKEGRKMLTGAIKDNVTFMTRWHLKCEQDGTLEQYTRVVGDGFVSGKL
jgi:hypothetical protein|tara:strand:- start:2419 stop:2700 length:282 start_codon:yes stop_codon:yes gene_type:complete